MNHAKSLREEVNLNKNSELFARNPVLLARPQTFVLHQILRHVSSSEFLGDALNGRIYLDMASGEYQQ